MNFKNSLGIFSILIFFIACFAKPINARDALWLQTTTSVENSGLLAYLLPFFEAEFGFKARVIAVGTGQALQNARRGDADALIVHAEELELGFMAEGFGKTRDLIMTNDFILVGPKNDTAQIGNCIDLKFAMEKILQMNAHFISRGDNSGTHIRELALWKKYNLTPKNLGRNYHETGQGMGNTLMIANEIGGYTISDRATWLSYNYKQDLRLICENFPPLVNYYSVIKVNKDKIPWADEEKAEKFRAWILSPRAQKLIGEYRVNDVILFNPIVK